MKKLLYSAVLAVTLVLAPSHAATASEPTVDEVCTVGGLAVPDGEPISTDVPFVMSCFDTIAEAEAFIDAGAPGDLELLLGEGAASRAAATTVTIGRIWTGTSRTGSVLIHWGAGTGCYGVTYGFPSLGSGWNDNVRSAQGYNNCWSSQYEHSSYGGLVVTCTPYCSSLGSLAAKTSSIVYRPNGTFG
jgi:hypothetical protein